MKQISKTTLRKRLREHRCPFCGCAELNRVDESYYPYELYVRVTCSRCGMLLVWADNSPMLNIFDEISSKNGTFENLLSWKRYVSYI